MKGIRHVRDIDLSVGSRVTCMMKKKEKIDTMLIGFERESFIVLKFPYLTCIGRYLQEQHAFIAHVQLGKSSVYFSSSIDMVVGKKFLAICEYPAMFKVVDKRDSSRVACLVPVGLFMNDVYYYGVMKDISLCGCNIVMDAVCGSGIRKISSGDFLTIEIFMHGTPVVVRGEVKHSSKNLSGTTLGIAFSNMDDKDYERISICVKEMQYRIM